MPKIFFFPAFLFMVVGVVDDWCWEVPAGSVKDGQSPLEAAQEELQEEVGGHSENWTYIGPLYTANGICNEIGHIFMVTDVQLREANHEPGEIIEIHQKSVAEVLQMAKIKDGSSALALLLCQNQLGEYL